MAAAFARQMAGDRVEAASAGSRPAAAVNTIMEEAMAAKGLDLYLRSPRSIEQALVEMKPDKIVTMGCAEECPVVPGTRIINWDIPDPAGEDISMMEEVRDQIEARVRELTQAEATHDG